MVRCLIIPKFQPKGTFQVKRNYSRVLKKRKRSIERRLGAEGYPDSSKPQIGTVNAHCQVSERNRVISCGGIGAIHLMVQRLGLIDQINREVKLFKRHQPYHESDHVLNIAYNAVVGGVCLEDIEQQRNDESFLDALGAERIPDPTTAGDFTRRFTEEDICDLMSAINLTRTGLYRHLEKAEGKGKLMERAYVDVDGTIAGTTGACKEGIALSYKGIWGYAPLVVSLANTREVLYLVNRSGNKISHDGWGTWADQAIELLNPHAERICLRGDTDFSTTQYFDRWDTMGVEFIFGMDAYPNLKKIAAEIGQGQWKPLSRPAKYTISTKGRTRPVRHKDRFIKAKGYKNLRLNCEHYAEFEYRPVRKCKKNYRVVVVRKNISVEKGELDLGDEIRFLFYITNRRDLDATEVVYLSNRRCNQENLIEQLKNGVNAMRMPVDTLLSNWAYMVMMALAWNLKVWFGLLVSDQERSCEIVTMDYRRFQRWLIHLPAQIVKTSRRVEFRFVGYNGWMIALLDTWENLRAMRLAG